MATNKKPKKVITHLFIGTKGVGVTKNQFHFFWNGVFSNWHDSEFTLLGIKYSCAEQAMMYQKAITFNDYKTAKLILEATLPKTQKELGRSVKNYDDSVWKEVRYSVVKEILTAKFEQNSLFKKELLKYKGLTFVEASPYDRIWGIGYDEYEAMENRKNWGENLLGKILTELSNEL